MLPTQQPPDRVKSLDNNDATNSWYLHANEDRIIKQDTLENSRTTTRNILWENITRPATMKLLKAMLELVNKKRRKMKSFGKQDIRIYQRQASNLPVFTTRDL